MATSTSQLIGTQVLQTSTYTEYSSIVDMGFIWRLATPTAEDHETVKRDGRSYLWLDYLEKVVSLVLTRHPAAITTISENDIYNKPNSIKDEEHERRAAKYIPVGAGNKFPKPNDPFPSPTEFNAFLSDSGNKTRLQRLIKNHLLQKNLNRQIVYCEGSVCRDISSNSELPHLALDHTEADTMMLTIYSIIRRDNPDLSVVIDSEDTAVYVQAAYVAHHVPGDLLIKRKDGLVNCKGLADEEMSDIIIAAHCITGCDHTPGRRFPKCVRDIPRSAHQPGTTVTDARTCFRHSAHQPVCVCARGRAHVRERKR